THPIDTDYRNDTNFRQRDRTAATKVFPQSPNHFCSTEEDLHMSLINTKVKPFKAQAYHNGKFVTVTEADLKGKWSAVVFYPADFTFVCPTELGDLADLYAEFKKIGVEIYSVSTDTHFTHKAWHDASDTIKKIQYPMIADPTGTISRN